MYGLASLRISPRSGAIYVAHGVSLGVSRGDKNEQSQAAERASSRADV